LRYGEKFPDVADDILFVLEERVADSNPQVRSSALEALDGLR